MPARGRLRSRRLSGPCFGNDPGLFRVRDPAIFGRGRALPLTDRTSAETDRDKELGNVDCQAGDGLDGHRL